MGLSPYISRFLPIHGNHMFPLGLQYEPFSNWRDKGLINAHSLYHCANGSLKPFHLIAEEFNLPTHHFLQVSQYSSFIAKICPKKSIRFQQSFLDKLIAEQRYSISDIYHPLNGKFTKPIHNTSITSWSVDLPAQVHIDNILVGYKITRSIIPNESWRETQFTLMHRAYYPFSTRHPSTSGALCPWCSFHKPSLLHRLWLCPQIATYWSTILNLIQKVTDFTPEKDPMLLLFEYSPKTSATPATSKPLPLENPQWTLLTLLIARRTILNHWISPSPLTVSETIKALKTLLFQVKFDAMLHKNWPNTKLKKKHWASFIDRCLTTSEKAIVNAPYFSYNGRSLYQTASSS